MSKSPAQHFSAEDVKNAAQGRWREILSSAGGIPADRLDGKGHPCPKCGGTDRFALVDAAAGAVHCRKCFSQKNGDGLAAIAWMLGCSFPDAIKKVADHLGLKATATNGQPHIAATYDYRDETGKLVFQAVRLEPKDFRQRKPKPDGSWEWSVKGVRVVPYRLPELLAAPTRVVFIVEGEKDVDNLARIEVTATCNAGGAGKWSAD